MYGCVLVFFRDVIAMSEKRTFFISRAGADRQWAELIADVVRNAGHEAIHQEQNFSVGASFSHNMMLAAESDCTIVVLSPAYFESEHCLAELHAALADDPLGMHGRILPVLVGPCKLPRLLGHLSFVDLQGLHGDTARQRLRDVLLKGGKNGEVPASSTSSRPLRRWQHRTGLMIGTLTLAVVVGAILLLIFWAGGSKRRGASSASNSIHVPFDHRSLPPEASAALRIESLEVQLYHGTSRQLRGTIGVLKWFARFNDNVRVSARLSAPAYCYLLALNTDGLVQFCPKAQETTPPSRRSEVVYPPAETDDLYGLTDGVGLQTFVLIASRQPLPAFANWPKRDTLPWRRSASESVWRFDGRDLTYLRDPTRGREPPPA